MQFALTLGHYCFASLAVICLVNVPELVGANVPFKYKPEREQLNIMDFRDFVMAKSWQRGMILVTPLKEQFNITQEQINNLTEQLARFSQYTEQIVFSTLKNRSDPALNLLRQETKKILEKLEKTDEEVKQSMNYKVVVPIWLDQFTENVASVLDESLNRQQPSANLIKQVEAIRVELSQLKEHTANWTLVQQKEKEIYRQLCQLDPENEFFRTAIKTLINRMAKQNHVCDEARWRHHDDYANMLDDYYEHMERQLKRLLSQNCETNEKDLILQQGFDDVFEVSDTIQQLFLRRM